MAFLRRETRGLAGVSGEMEESMKLDRGERSIGVQVSGVEPELGPMRRLDPRAGGRFLNPIDEARSRRVLFLGDTLAGDLFGAEDPVGATVLLQGLPFTVVGVLEKKLQESSYSVRDTDKAYIPASAFRAITGREVLEYFVFQAADPAGTPALRDEVIRLLKRLRKQDVLRKDILAPHG